MTPRLAIAACLLIAPLTAGATDGLAYTDDLGLLHQTAIVTLDVRPLAVCEHASVPDARCLPASELLGPHGRLPDFRQIMWLFGTLGLSGRETVLVAGDHALRRDFVAGVLYLAGQHRVLILQRSLRTVLHDPTIGEARGRPRSLVADPIYEGRVRADLIVWREELARMLSQPNPPLLVDGRGLDAYRGMRIDAYRGGHIPGAQSLPADSLSEHPPTRPSADALEGAIAYAADPMRGIAYFAALRAGLGARVRIYPGGWRAWAAHTALPVADETYATRPAIGHTTDHPAAPAWRWFLVALLAGLAGGAIAFTTLYLTTRKVSWN
ncbi:hypothetical protein BI364_06470 [Acidihalobacter yilgarnensis]|uniref:Rhodanese domain-containing protein n=1 Tax=Acidihalobacter yilgarnensis TaxID=2819280 RepID=A0A1D8IMF9_9GAMM|nr:rhodanese-like domain-containing protein [Acidihalobacter yilgarnensis]AOU97648.1 hypothetical protein BI364_06470 [Acidihalobacter yilgarnensis]